MPKAIITAGATLERIDPVRYISNFSSGKQGYAIAEVLAKRGVEVILISGKTNLPTPHGVKLLQIESADEMLKACEDNLPADIAIFAAAVCDWKPENLANNKLKKADDIDRLAINLVKNPDILKTIATHSKRPRIIIGFAAETENVLENARKKLISKNADFIIANLVGNGTSTFGGDYNQVTILDKNGERTLPSLSKHEVAEIIADLAL